MEHLLPHYQTAFSVAPASPETPLEPLFATLQDSFRRWLLKLENARAKRFNNKAYGLTPDARFASGSEDRSWRSSYKTSSGSLENGPAWALLYSHKDDDIEGLSWLYDITLQALPSDTPPRIAIHLSVQRSLSPDLFQKENVRYPDPAPPLCIRRLFDSVPDVQFLSGTTPITPPPDRLLRIADSEPDVLRLVEELRSPSRNLPFVLLIGAATDPANFAESLAHDLVGKAIVANVPNRPNLLAPLAPFKLSLGQSRILFPFNRFGPRLRAHPLGSFATPQDAEAFRAFARPLILSQFTATEPNAIPSHATLASLLARASLAQRRSNLLHSPSTPSDSWDALAKDLYAETSRLRKFNADLAHELQALRDRLFIAEKLADKNTEKHPSTPPASPSPKPNSAPTHHHPRKKSR